MCYYQEHQSRFSDAVEKGTGKSQLSTNQRAPEALERPEDLHPIPQAGMQNNAAACVGVSPKVRRRMIAL